MHSVYHKEIPLRFFLLTAYVPMRDYAIIWFILSIERDVQLCTSLYDKCGVINIHDTNIPFSSTIIVPVKCGVLIKYLVRNIKISSSLCVFYSLVKQLPNKLLGQRYIIERVKLPLRMCYGRYGDLVLLSNIAIR